MTRELLAEARMDDGDTPQDAHGAAANVVIGELVERWKNGVQPPGMDAHVENVHLKDKDGNLLGFRFYLVADEPVILGRQPTEILEE